MSENNPIEWAKNAEPFDPVAAFLDLKFRKKGHLVKLKGASDGVPVYFIHELTGTVSCYHHIVKAIEAPVFGIQVPQSERSASAISTIESLAAKYVELIVENQPEGPMRLVGWSAGATTALEVARQLTSIGRQPQLIVNIDQSIDNAKGLVGPYHSFLENLYYWLCNEPKWPISKFGGRLLEKFTEAITNRSAPKPTDPFYDPKSVVDKAKTPEEADFVRKFNDLVFSYIPPRSYSGQVLSFVASENPVSDKLIKSWKSIARNSQFVFVSGDHETLVRGPGVVEVCEHIRKAFSKPPTTPIPATPAKRPNRLISIFIATDRKGAEGIFQARSSARADHVG